MSVHKRLRRAEQDLAELRQRLGSGADALGRRAAMFLAAVVARADPRACLDDPHVLDTVYRRILSGYGLEFDEELDGPRLAGLRADHQEAVRRCTEFIERPARV